MGAPGGAPDSHCTNAVNDGTGYNRIGRGRTGHDERKDVIKHTSEALANKARQTQLQVPNIAIERDRERDFFLQKSS